MQAAGIKKELEKIRKDATTNSERNPIIEETIKFWEDVNKERVSEGKRPVVFVWNNFQNIMVNEIFYEPNLAKIDEFRIQDGKILLLPLYLAGEYQKVKEEIQRYDAYFFHKIPHSTLLKEMCQPTADLWGFEDIDTYHEAERLFMQDQKLYHLHNKPELGREFAEYLIESWEKEGAVLEFDKEKQLFLRQPAKIKPTERGMMISEKKRNYLELIEDSHQSGDFKFIYAVQVLEFFEFLDNVAVPGQLITLRYEQTGQYKDQGVWSAEYSETGETLSISNINLWVWIHSKDISAKIREIKEENKNESDAIEKPD